MSIPDIYRGDTLNYNFTFKDKDGNAIDISSTTLWFTMKRSPSDKDASAALQDSVTFPADANSVAGLGSIAIAATDTALLTPGVTYYYDFQWVDGTEVTTLAAGTVTALQDITISTS